ncbi:protein of unknown function [Flexibacter flexilis DSM 6793]|uniref:YfiR family protein n=1 Tax=Flexibacter flexilis DSM 6793 TaxID=927664 RepID=A0A1I1LLS1_9BACT|nr:YfiR family protein [Flexibacter flexilis]SFC73989.1 protein of unknown function [Flexibacter flexilis DSM 6793]
MKYKLLLFWLISFWIGQQPCMAQQELDYRLASLFIYNFTNYIQWPEPVHSQPDFVIGVVGSQKATKALTEMAKVKKANRVKPIVVHQITNLKEIGRCNLVLLTHEETAKFKDVLAAVGEHPILLVTEKQGLAEKGAAINLFLENGNKTRFELNKHVTDKHGFKVSTQLIDLAVVVK